MDIAVWGHPASEFPEGKDSVADIRTWLGKLREAGIGKYIPFVTSGGQAIFESVALGPPQRDLLGPIIEVAGETGMEVHPIVGLGGVTPGFSEDEGYYVPLERPGKELPDWSRKWTDPAWYENVELICQVSEELLDNYACGGLHMDAVRYPNSSVLNEHPCVRQMSGRAGSMVRQGGPRRRGPGESGRGLCGGEDAGRTCGRGRLGAV